MYTFILPMLYTITVKEIVISLKYTCICICVHTVRNHVVNHNIQQVKVHRLQQKTRAKEKTGFFCLAMSVCLFIYILLRKAYE